MIVRRVAVAAALLGLLIADCSPAFAQRHHRPVGTAVSRAIGNCRVVRTGAAIVGGVFGLLLGGRRHRVEGGVIGVGAGALVGGLACAIMLRNAERQDEIVAAQMAAAAGPVGTPYSRTIGGDADGKGGGLQLLITTEDVPPPAQLVQVRYPVAGGGEAVSPQLGAGQRWCRRDNTQAIENGQQATLPPQLYCRDNDHGWAPYAERGARST